MKKEHHNEGPLTGIAGTGIQVTVYLHRDQPEHNLIQGQGRK